MITRLSRRTLLRWAAAVGSAALARPATLLAQDKKAPLLSVQLFSVRGDCGKDFDGALKQVAEMGFDGVEFAGYYKYGGDAAGLRKKLDELNLKAAATHLSADSLAGDRLRKTVDFHRTIGCKFLIVAGDWRFTKPDKSREYADFMNKTAEALKLEGMFTGHHNHTGEMTVAEGDKMWWDLFAERTSKDVILQQDMGHTMFVGIDPTALVRKYPGRTRTTHIKCRPPKGKKAFVGEDCFDWKAYFTACIEVGGTEWLSLEQEEYPDGKSAMECTRISLDATKRILKEIVW